MQCQLCDNQATVHLTEILNGLKTEKHLCEHCARKEGIIVSANAPVKSLLSNIVGSQAQAQQASQLSCPDCGMTFQQFRKGGLLGCAKDYEIFAEPLRKLIEKAQEGACQHIGRHPNEQKHSAVEKVKMQHLRQQLEQAVDQEDYEAAARIRDEIEHFQL